MPVILGDLDNDGKLTTKDLTIMNSYINEINEYSLTGNQLIAADLNNDGVVDNNDLTFGINYLADNNSADEYFDPDEISGEFKIKSTSINVFDSFDINNIILNTGGSFTNRAQSIEKNEADGFSILTVNFTYDTTKARRSNDGVFLANTDYEVLSWGGIPLSRNWSVFNTTYNGTGLFESFTGKISTTGDDQPTILRTTSFKNIFKDTDLLDEDYGNFDLWDTRGVTQVSIQGKLINGGYQIDATVQLINKSTSNVITEINSGYTGDFQIDVNPNELEEETVIKMVKGVNVAFAREDNVIQETICNKSLNALKGKSINIVSLGSLSTIYSQNEDALLKIRKIRNMILKRKNLIQNHIARPVKGGKVTRSGDDYGNTDPPDDW